MTDLNHNPPLLKTAPFTVKRYNLEPEQFVFVPRGVVVLTAFVGRVAYAWVQHHPEAPHDMQLLTVPSDQNISLELDPLYHHPTHAGSFFMTDASKLVPSAWHVFMFMPKAKPGGLLGLPN